MEETKYITALFEATQESAQNASQCNKAQVGAVIFERVHGIPHVVSFGCNHTYPVSCKDYGCKRMAVYGEDSDKHRLPSDCRAIHAEIDAIAFAAKEGIYTNGLSMLITRYPCESCAKAIVSAGIYKVYYGGKQLISEETKAIFDDAGVTVIHLLEGEDYEVECK